MIDTKFTPGPWAVGPMQQFNDDFVVKADGILHVAHICKDSASFEDGDFLIDEDQQMANSHLIAAAPELFHAAQRIEQAICAGLQEGWIKVGTVSGMDLSHEMNAITAAIAKAEGRSA